MKARPQLQEYSRESPLKLFCFPCIVSALQFACLLLPSPLKMFFRPQCKRHGNFVGPEKENRLLLSFCAGVLPVLHLNGGPEIERNQAKFRD